MHPWTTTNTVLAGLACVAGLACCGSASMTSSATNSATVTGGVLAGPTCPVEQANHRCPPRPVVARVTAHNQAGRAVASTNSGRDGTYQLHVPPGTYTLIATPPEQLPHCTPVEFTADPGNTARVDITCDTGIR